jgi:hypothetical protein
MMEIIAPTFINSIKEILIPAFFAIPIDMIFAEAPIMVIFPPKHAPSANAHQSKFCNNGFDSFIISIIGIIVIVNGILSKNPEAIPETH